MSTRETEAEKAGAVRGEWFTLHDDGVVYRTEKTGDNTARYVVVARGCSVDHARLIAAAPEMYEALRWVRANYASGSTKEINACIDAVIAKATGAQS